MADVPLSVKKSMITWSLFNKKVLKCAAFKNSTRSLSVLILIDSTDLILNGSMIVLNSIMLFFQ